MQCCDLENNRQISANSERPTLWLRTLVTSCKRQQSNVPSLLDGAGKAALVRGANASETPGNDLAALSDKPLQQANVAVRDGIDFLGAELADLLATEELAAAARATGGTGSACGATAAAGVRTGAGLARGT
jgi:hypothetical protein